MQTPFYNTQHSPIGAFASFTLGAQGAKGGLGLELSSPACENLWIGCEDRDGKRLQALPFFAAQADAEAQFATVSEDSHRPPLVAFAASLLLETAAVCAFAPALPAFVW